MKKLALIITSFTVLMLLSETDLFTDLLLFFLVGAIPGTHYSLPSSVMLFLTVVTAGAVVYWFLKSHGWHVAIARFTAKIYDAIKSSLRNHSLGSA